jgi:hypothetical protein
MRVRRKEGTCGHGFKLRSGHYFFSSGQSPFNPASNFHQPSVPR